MKMSLVHLNEENCGSSDISLIGIEGVSILPPFLLFSALMQVALGLHGELNFNILF